MSWGSGPRGRTPWGGSPLAATNASAVVELSQLEVLAEDTLLLTFSEQMSNTDDLRDYRAYIISTEDGEPVEVREVLSGGDDFTDTIALVVTRPTLGSTYCIAVPAGLQSAAGNTMDPDLVAKEYVGRNTKMDKSLRIMPKLFNKTHKSNYRVIMQAIMREDDLIGGNKEDFLD